MYCRACHYALTGLPEPRCPECGRVFDPADPATFTLDPQDLAWWRLARRVAGTIGILLVIAVLVLGWAYRGYQEERKILAALGAKVGASGSPFLPDRWNQWLSRAGCPTFTRARAIVIYNRGTTDAELRLLARLRSLRDLHLGSDQITDAGIGYLADLPNLRSLELECNHLTASVVVQLKRLTELRVLGLWHVELTDAGYRELASLQNLTALRIQGGSISQAGLDYLKSLPRLQELQLHFCQLMPEATASIGTWDHLRHLAIAGIEPCSTVREFKRMKNLRSLNIVGSSCENGSWHIIEEFRRARPDVSFDGP